MYRVMRKNLLSWWLRQYRICLKHGRPRFDPWVRKIPWRRNWQLSPVFLPGESHGERSLARYSPWSQYIFSQIVSAAEHCTGQIVKPKCWSWNSNTLATWCKELTHLKRPWGWEKLRAGGEGMTENEMVGWHHQLNGHEFEQALSGGDGQGGLACCSS